MTLTLKIVNRDRLENGSPTELVLHNRGAIIGRSATCEWPLPDDGRVLSRNHCKIVFDNGAYMLEDTSVNGTFLGQAKTPISAPHRLKPNDMFKLGPFEIRAQLSGDALSHHDSESASKQKAGKRQDWDAWDDTPQNPKPSISQDNDMDDSWGVEAAETEDVSHWSDKQDAQPVGPTPDEIFETLSDNHEVDWDSAAWDVESDFDPFLSPGDTPAPQNSDPFGSLDPNASDDFDTDFKNAPVTPAESDAAPDNATQWGDLPGDESPVAPSPQQAPNPSVQHTAAPAANHSPADNSQEVFKKLIAELGVPSASLSGTPEETATRAGRLLRRLLTGLVTLLEARARAKDAMGASATQLRLDGNNPLKFARDIDQALLMVMNPARPGYMEIDIAIEDSYRDLQAHQIATLKAMQGALKATLNRFSPETIKTEAKENGFLTKILPSQRDAALWKAYEKQFNGSVQGSAEAFFDTFSVEFRKAYEDATRKR